MAEYKVAVSAPADRDLQEIFAYISEELSVPETELNLLAEIDKALHGLGDLPQRNALVADLHLARMGFRKLLIKNYIVFYLVDDNTKTVDIIRVLYARRDWMNLL